MCRVLKVHRSGFYAWLRCPQSERAMEDRRLLGLIRESYLASGASYGSPRVHEDLLELGERCGEKRVARLMRSHRIQAQRGYKKPRHKYGKPSVVAPNMLGQQFGVAAPDYAWVTDITYLRTYEGWLYLAVVRGGPCISDSLLRWISRLFEESTDEQTETIRCGVQGKSGA